jgi:hypothetical protein
MLFFNSSSETRNKSKTEGPVLINKIPGKEHGKEYSCSRGDEMNRIICLFVSSPSVRFLNSIWFGTLNETDIPPPPLATTNLRTAKLC